VIEAGAHPVIRTKGDANAQADPWNARLDGSAVWRVRATVPVVGYAAMLMREAWIAVLVSGLGVVGLLALALRRVWRHDDNHGAHPHVAARH
jgi:signal peptidase